MNDIRFALRQLRKSPGFTSVVVITLALGIGANAAIFTLVRGVLIKPLVNRDEARLIYIRQSAPGMGQENSTWSMPEIGDLKERVKTLSEFGDFSTIAFTLIGLGEPREVNGGVVNGSYFDVMGLHPVLGRLISREDDGPKAASVLVLTYRFWSDTLNRDPSVIGKTVQLGERSAVVIGVLEPCVPYPQETAVRTAVGASRGALRRMLLAESLLLCGAGAALGGWSALFLVDVLARYASRFSVRALDLTVDSSLLWVGVALTIVAAVILAFVPRLPDDASGALHLSSGSVRITGSRGRQRIFVITQISGSFILLAGASVVVTTLLALQRTETGMDSRHVLAINVPAVFYGKTRQQLVDFYKEVIRRIDSLPDVNKTAFGMVAPWRDAGSGPTLQFCADGHDHSGGEEDPRAQYRVISPGFFAALGVPIVAGRDFNESDVQSKERVAVISQTLAQRMFPNQDPINRHVFWTDPVLKSNSKGTPELQRIIGVTADIDDVHLVTQPSVSISITVEQGPF